MAESAPLLREYTLIAYRGFESLPLRQIIPSFDKRRYQFRSRKPRQPPAGNVSGLTHHKASGKLILRVVADVLTVSGLDFGNRLTVTGSLV